MENFDKCRSCLVTIAKWNGVQYDSPVFEDENIILIEEIDNASGGGIFRTSEGD